VAVFGVSYRLLNLPSIALVVSLCSVDGAFARKESRRSGSGWSSPTVLLDSCGSANAIVEVKKGKDKSGFRKKNLPVELLESSLLFSFLKNSRLEELSCLKIKKKK